MENKRYFLADYLESLKLLFFSPKTDLCSPSALQPQRAPCPSAVTAPMSPAVIRD